jgi:hypothetical protein
MRCQRCVSAWRPQDAAMIGAKPTPKFILKRENLPADEDLKPLIVLPLEDPGTGEVVFFVSCSVGGKIAVEKLIQAAARTLWRRARRRVIDKLRACA